MSDNASTDDTAQVAREYADRGVRYALNSGRADWAAGLPGFIDGESNWNYVMSLASGEYVTLYHADDVYDPSMLCEQARILQTRPDVSSAFTLCRYIDDWDRPIHLDQFRLPDDVRGRGRFDFTALVNTILKHGNILITPTLMTRRETLQNVGMFDGARFRTAADLDLWLRMARWQPVAIVEKPLHQYRVGPNQGGMKIASQRVDVADFFRVIDHYLTDPEVQARVDPEALRYYEMERAADQVLCAMNLLAQSRVAEARARLRAALAPAYFATARYRPRRLARLLVGLALLASISAGRGAALGSVLRRAYLRDLARRRRPVEAGAGGDHRFA